MKTNVCVQNLQDIGRVPMPGDNAAIAVKRLEAGTLFSLQECVYALSDTTLEGHRFAIETILQGEFIYSWGLPFGRALRTIHTGEYLCNAGILAALGLRGLDFTLPPEANFEDHVSPYELDKKTFKPGKQVSLYSQTTNFEGYARSGSRDSGTRNFIIVLGTTSLTTSYVKALVKRLQSETDNHTNIDGIVAVTHTEGGGNQQPNNFYGVLRTLAGFMVHGNIGAVLAVDYGTEVITNRMLEDYMRGHDYPLDHVLHRFYSVEKDFETALKEGEKILHDWLSPVNAMARTPQPLSQLKIALQCGGSDAFSGVSGNPLAGWVAKEVIKHGGAAALAETDELIGAEPYMLANTRDLATAKLFLEKIAVFKERVAWHGHSAEGNPSGGNKFRGLYNIAIKSIGAARKKDPEVRLDYVIEYGQPMTGPGFYFMDSPGNDLESIAGQVASGCNMIFFITGNGSITNFPFVPTIKFITTTERWKLLSDDMDVNAGRYQGGMPMDKLGTETFRYTLDVASGMLSIGERARHSQVSIWRDWHQTDGLHLREIQNRSRPEGKPVTGLRAKPDIGDVYFEALKIDHDYVTDQVGLIVPTSLCSGQIARMITDDLNAGDLPAERNISRFIALTHTEGCGCSSGENEEHYTRTLMGHLMHPFVKKALLLEHGCERTHNDLIRHVLKEHDLDIDRFGYASVQLDGGINKVVNKVTQWFSENLPIEPPASKHKVSLEALSLGLLSRGDVSEVVVKVLGWIVAVIVSRGGTVVIPENASLLKSADFIQELGLTDIPLPTLNYGQFSKQAGLHIMATPTEHMVETQTGLGGTGVQQILAHVQGPPLQGHPMIPTIQIATSSHTDHHYHQDMDHMITVEQSDPEQISEALLQLLCDTASRSYEPKLWQADNTDFQMTRGMLGISL